MKSVISAVVEKTQQNPLALKIVAALFVFLGVVAVIDIFLSLMRGHLNFNFNALGIFIGPGLLRHQRGWRTCALVFIWMGLIACPIVAFLLMNSSGPLDVSVFSQKIGHAPREYGVWAGVFMFFLSLWQYRVLTNPEVRRLFIPPPRWMQTG